MSLASSTFSQYTRSQDFPSQSPAAHLDDETWRDSGQYSVRQWVSSATDGALSDSSTLVMGEQPRAVKNMSISEKTKVTNLTQIYYRLHYGNQSTDVPVSRNMVDPSDPSLGSVSVNHIKPPHNAAGVLQFLCAEERMDAKAASGALLYLPGADRPAVPDTMIEPFESESPKTTPKYPFRIFILSVHPATDENRAHSTISQPGWFRKAVANPPRTSEEAGGRLKLCGVAVYSCCYVGLFMSCGLYLCCGHCERMLDECGCPEPP